MRCYLLLRNNVETGPFTLEELAAQSLKTTDLVWLEGESTAWKYPTELEALKSYVVTDDVTTESRVESSRIINTSKGIFVALPLHEPDLKPKEEQEVSVELETRFAQPLDALQEQYNSFKKKEPFQFRKTFSKPHHALWLVCVFAGSLFCAFLIKNIVDTYDANPLVVTAAAALPVTDDNSSKNSPEDNLYQNALTTEIVPVDTVTLKPLKKEAHKVDLNRLVHLEANDYQVGLLGGIKNLRMLVVNKSALVLNKVSFQLQYLKPNGDVIKTENLLLKSVAPKSSKSLAIPSNKRGVKVAYHITGIQSKQGSDALLHL